MACLSHYYFSRRRRSQKGARRTSADRPAINGAGRTPSTAAEFPRWDPAASSAGRSPRASATRASGCRARRGLPGRPPPRAGGWRATSCTTRTSAGPSVRASRRAAPGRRSRSRGDCRGGAGSIARRARARIVRTSRRPKSREGNNCPSTDFCEKSLCGWFLPMLLARRTHRGRCRRCCWVAPPRWMMPYDAPRTGYCSSQSFKRFIA